MLFYKSTELIVHLLQIIQIKLAGHRMEPTIELLSFRLMEITTWRRETIGEMPMICFPVQLQVSFLIQVFQMDSLTQTLKVTRVETYATRGSASKVSVVEIL